MLILGSYNEEMTWISISMVIVWKHQQSKMWPDQSSAWSWDTNWNLLLSKHL